MSRQRLAQDNESAYELDSQFDEEEEYQSDSDQDQDHQDQDQEETRSTRRSSVYSNASTVADNNDAYLQAAESAMGTLQTLHSSPSSHWKRALKHRSGVVVFVSKDKSYAGGAKKNSGGKGGHYAHVFKGEHTIEGFGPAAVFGVVGTRKLWDDWYNEGNLVENLNDTTSLTYMCMKGVVGTSTRDLSLVERVAGNATGTILFVSTSVVTPKVPRVSGRVRASIALNGWVLEPSRNGGTKVTYYLHVNVKTFVPSFAAVKYLARRPTCISRIDDYLQSHGPPPMGQVESVHSSSDRTLINGHSTSSKDDPSRRRRRDSTVSKRSTRSRAESVATQSSVGPTGSLPVHVKPNTDVTSFAEIQKAQKLFKSLLATYPSQEWTVAQDAKGGKIWMKQRDSDGLPVVLGEALVEGVTTEMVLGTILSEAARREWDPRFNSTGVVALDNGFDQGVHVECIKGIFPKLGARHFTLVRGVDREDLSTDNGQILLVSRSTRIDINPPKNSTKAQMDLIGWLIEDHSNHSSSVKITMIAQLDLKDRLAPFVQKILISELALAPTAVAAYIDDHGYAPFFVRWGAGPAQLISDGESDLINGKAIFKILGDGQGTMIDGQQKCWMQWSDKMYPRGIDIAIVPASAATITRVEGMGRTVEFTWSEEVKSEGGAKIVVKRARHGNGAEDVYLQGQFVDAVTAMAKGSGGAAAAGGGGVGMAKKKATKKVAPPAPASAPAPSAFDDDASPPVADARRSSKMNGNGVDKALPAPIAIRATSPTPYLAPVAKSSPPQSQSQPAAGSQAQSGYEQGVKRNLPEDACLIISPDLYFTRSQCAFIAGFAFFAFLWGKLF